MGCALALAGCCSGAGDARSVDMDCRLRSDCRPDAGQLGARPPASDFLALGHAGDLAPPSSWSTVNAKLLRREEGRESMTRLLSNLEPPKEERGVAGWESESTSLSSISSMQSSAEVFGDRGESG
eukprot:1749815-Rhodomonas_salina.1